MKIPFNIPATREESYQNVKYLVDNPLAIAQKKFTKACEDWFKELYPEYHALLVTSCTKAMELIALSIDVQDGDEIIMPSYSYVGVANSFVNLGARLVLVDIEPETMNIDASLIEEAITPRTKAVVVMHYSGVTCEMQKIVEVCQRRNIVLIEDNAQGIGARFQGKLLGALGDFSCISFDSLKNISCGEGGILLFKEKHRKSVEVCFENGTNRHEFMEGKAALYEWVNRGSKFVISEFNAAILHPLLLQSESIIQKRRAQWQQLYDAIAAQSALARLLTPKLLAYEHNAHIFFLKSRDKSERDNLIKHLNSKGIASSFHYTPLHTSLRGKELGFGMKEDRFTTSESDRLLRLPIYSSLTREDIEYIVSSLAAFF
jgi:dTDP-4-amino-4,6-dideoxygalactose transaminase